MSGDALRPDWLVRLLSALMTDPHASIEQLARSLSLRPSAVRHELAVFYQTELHTLPIQWWAPLGRLLAQEPNAATVSAPARRAVRSCVGCGVPLVHGGRGVRCHACSVAHRSQRNRERYRRLRAERACTRCGQLADRGVVCASCLELIRSERELAKTRQRKAVESIDAIFAREKARARREFHVDPWQQRGAYGAEMANRGPDTRGLA